MGKTIAVIGALDTKGADFAFVKGEIERRGRRALVIDVSVMGKPAFRPDVSAAEVAKAGGVPLKELQKKADKALAMTTMTKGIAVVVKRLYDKGRIHGVLSMGGGAGTVIGTAAMRALPIGFPKLMVSTIASGDTSAYVGTKDIVMMPSVVDVAGVNRISAPIYANAVGAIVGMVEARPPKIKAKPLLAASMFGNTTPIVTRCVAKMAEHGYETVVFHATGTGGRTMESLIDEGLIEGVLDITTTEWADELCGGVLTAGPTRGDAAARRGIPQVICPGCLDMVNFWAPETVPAKYQGRRFYRWNPNITLMRTTPEENAALGRILAEKANASKGMVAFFLPLRGVSMLDAPGKDFWWPEADAALFDAIKQHVKPGIPVIQLDNNINDDAFADAVAAKLFEFLSQKVALPRVPIPSGG
ncbi:MAG TPA: Tm-1-like ATP-binding domain-containing protein [Planctomycetota bacterium]|nr:Tm-1-like ATP-binding domain-containing protein [Planctomycetota bacterium]HRR82636.1 Tm-1-like ATP-binding domain-containing protein [Planctomycetota bacterium]HRT96013.1 Tm-1-like ATP-binding domain-containing protein [Planctomycetota bacterium]